MKIFGMGLFMASLLLLAACGGDEPTTVVLDVSGMT